jgi:hypothetical protein
MRKWGVALLLSLLLAVLTGCSGEKDRNKNKDKDRPRQGKDG